jgi:hypothetical protein
MNNCKICALLPNEELQSLLRDKSTRYIAERYDFSRTTVSRHNNRCNKNTQIATSDKDDVREIIWNGDSGELRTGALDAPLTDISPESILKLFGHDIKETEMIGVLRERHSEYYSRDLDRKIWKHSYAFSVQKRKHIENDIDPIKLIKELGIKSKVKTAKTTQGTESTFVLDWADWQVGKKEGGGTVEFLNRFDNAMVAAVERITELRKTGRTLDELVIIGGGDMIEGCVIYPQQSFGIDMSRRNQIKTTVATILNGLYILAPMFDKVRVIVAPGNHGEHRINGYKTELGDNDDLLVFEIAQLGLENDPNFSHVSFEIAEHEMSVVTDILGWTYGVTHGDVYGKGSGNGIRNKVFNWFKTMAANRHAVGDADVLVTHHFHHDALEDWGATLWVQNPTMDGGSHYFVEATGHKPKHGMNSWVVTRSDRFQDKQVLR